MDARLFRMIGLQLAYYSDLTEGAASLAQTTERYGTNQIRPRRVRFRLCECAQLRSVTE